MLKLTIGQFKKILKIENIYNIDFKFDFEDENDEYGNVVQAIVNISNENGFDYYITNEDELLKSGISKEEIDEFYELDFEDEILPYAYEIYLNRYDKNLNY